MLWNSPVQVNVTISSATHPDEVEVASGSADQDCQCPYACMCLYT